MIKINNKPNEWSRNMSVFDLFKIMGYSLKKPAVLIKVNNEVIPRDLWANFILPDNSEITVINLLRGG